MQFDLFHPLLIVRVITRTNNVYATKIHCPIVRRIMMSVRGGAFEQLIERLDVNLRLQAAVCWLEDGYIHAICLSPDA